MPRGSEPNDSELLCTNTNGLNAKELRIRDGMHVWTHVGGVENSVFGACMTPAELVHVSNKTEHHRSKLNRVTAEAVALASARHHGGQGAPAS
jgi:hypothetical protein